MYCSHCYRQIEDGSKVCPNCGKVPEIRIGFSGSAPDPVFQDNVVHEGEVIGGGVGSTGANSNSSYCSKCGRPLSGPGAFCSFCGAQATPATNYYSINVNQATRHSMTMCPKCYGRNVQFAAVAENKPVGCLTVLLYIILIASGIGILVLIFLLMRKKTKTVTYAVCQDCGYKWRK